MQTNCWKVNNTIIILSKLGRFLIKKMQKIYFYLQLSMPVLFSAQVDINS